MNRQSQAFLPKQVILFVLLYAVAISFSLNNVMPYKGDESFYVVSALNMVETGDLLVPEYFGNSRFQKPILPYWMAYAGLRVFGINLWGPRVPFLLMACAALLLMYRFGRMVRDEHEFGYFAMLCLSACILFVAFSRHAMTDLPLMFFCTLSLYFFAASTVSRRILVWYSAAYAAAGLAFMSKGIIGILPIAAHSICLGIVRPEKTAKRTLYLVHPLPVSILAAITVPWYWYAWATHQDAFKSVAQSESGMIGVEVSEVVGKLVFYFVMIAVATFPFAIIAAIHAVRKRKEISFPPQLTSPIVFSIMVILLFSLFVHMRKERYLLPIMPSVVLATSYVLYSASKSGVYRKWAWTVFLLLALYFSSYPLVARQKYRDIVSKVQALSGKVAVADIGKKEIGWVRLMSGNSILTDTVIADYILTDESFGGEWERYDTVSSFANPENVKYKDGRFEVTVRPFYILKKKQ